MEKTAPAEKLPQYLNQAQLQYKKSVNPLLVTPKEYINIP